MKNMKKLLLGVTLGALIIGTGALGVQAAGNEYGMNKGMQRGMNKQMSAKYQEMSAEQKETFKARHDSRVAERKAMLKEDVASGRITQEQADMRIKAMEDHFRDVQEGKTKTGLKGEYRGQKYSEMTAEQKDLWQKRHEQRVAERKVALNEQVKSGKISQADADARIANMEKRFESIKNGTAERGRGQGLQDGSGYGKGLRDGSGMGKGLKDGSGMGKGLRDGSGMGRNAEGRGYRNQENCLK